jgi:hypothetical protein
MAVAVLGVSAGLAWGQSDYRRYYVGPDQGVWSDPANWAVSPAGVGGAGVPAGTAQGLPFDGANGAVVAAATDTAVTFDMDYGSASLVSVDMLASGGATLTVTHPQGTLRARGVSLDSAGGGSVCYLNYGGRLVTPVPSGAISVATSAGANASYLLTNGGSVSTDTLYVGKGGTGSLYQQSGSVSAATNLFVGYAAGASGTYVLGTGNLSADGETIGGQGTGLLRQTGGTNWSSYDVTIGSHGTYELGGGTLRSDQGQIVVAAGGAFHQTGGSLEALALNVDGTYEQTGGTAAVGALRGTGTFALGGEAELVVNSGGFGGVRDLAASGRLASSTTGGGWGIGYGTAESGGVLVRSTLLGDANLDGRIATDDYAALNAGTAAGTGWWADGDFNYDGVVDEQDYLLIDRSLAWQDGAVPAELLESRQAMFGPAYVADLQATVPEPGTAGLLAVGAGLLVRRRRRH